MNEEYCDDICCEIMEKLVDAAKTAVSEDISSVDAHELGEVIDMIKDISEYKRNRKEACYYEHVVKAMEDNAEESYRMGYIDNLGAVANDPQYASRYDKYGKMYHDYVNSRRHYTETHSVADKENMNRNAEKHISAMEETVKDIWSEADPELKSKIKEHMTALMNQLV